MRGRFLCAATLCLIAATLAVNAGEATWSFTFPHGGTIPPGALTVDRSDPGVVYTAPMWTGLYRSGDGAGSWVAKPGHRYISWIDTGAGGTVYVLAQRHTVDTRAIFRSGDGGDDWTDLTAGLAGDFTALAVDPATPGHLYAGTARGDLYRSTDGGASWQRRAAGLPSTAITRIVIADGPAGLLFLISDDNGVLRSRDHGLSWEALTLAAGDPAVEDLLVHPAAGALFAVGRGPGTLFRSFDGGDGWTRLDFDPGDPAPGWHPFQPGGRLLAAGGGQAVYCISRGGILASEDMGATWRFLPVDEPDVPTFTLAVANPAIASPAAADDRPVLYAGTGTGVYRSDDGGASWMPASEGLRGSVVGDLELDASDPRFVYVGGFDGSHGVGRRSTDGGAGWEQIAFPDNGLSWIATHPGRPGVVYGLHNDLYRSDDRGLTWDDVTGNEIGAFVEGTAEIAPSDPDTLYLAGVRGEGTTSEVYRSADAGLTWEAIGGGLDGLKVWDLAVDPRHREVVYAAASAPRRPLHLLADRFRVEVAWSAGDGTLREGSPGRLTDTTGSFWFFHPDNLEVVVKVLDGCAVNGHVWVFAAGLTNVGLEVTVTDTLTGSQWRHPNPAGSPFQPVRDTTAFATCGPDGHHLPARDRATALAGGLYKTEDGGRTWRRLGGGLPPGYPAYQVVVHPLEPDRVYVTDEGGPTPTGGLFRSDDAGATWRPILGGGAFALDLHPEDPDVLFANGLDYTTDGGATWQSLPMTGLSPHDLPYGPMTETIRWDPADPGRLLLATHGGVYETRLPDPAAPGRAVPDHAAGSAEPPTEMLLADGRFRVRATWETATAAGTAHPQPLTGRTGYLWFFRPHNVEIVLKVLDGCAVNGRHWVFATGLTNVGTRLQVDDLESGATWVHVNPAGAGFPSVFDTAAFTACP